MNLSSKRASGETGDDDFVMPFQIEGTNVRGQIVRLGRSIDETLQKHGYPDPVSNILGEALLLAAMMGSSLKFDGRIVLQTSSNGPVPVLIAEYTTEGNIRGYARIQNGEADGMAAAPGSNPAGGGALKTLLGEGHLAISIDQGPDTELYQGLVALDGENFTRTALTYFARSEQLLTAIRLTVGQHVDHTGRQTWRGGGIMVQNLPEKEAGRKVTDRSLDDWERADMLLSTVEDHELIDPTLEARRLLYRLYHEDGVRAFEGRPVSFGCSCNAERLKALLGRLSEQDRRELEEDGAIKAKCEFCSTEYVFDNDAF